MPIELGECPTRRGTGPYDHRTGPRQLIGHAHGDERLVLYEQHAYVRKCLVFLHQASPSFQK
jgi:hypothetical protein